MILSLSTWNVCQRLSPLPSPHWAPCRCGKDKSRKKNLSAVEGNPLPTTINDIADILAIPTTRIYNISYSTFTWPDLWREETQSAIPKTSAPRSYEDLRNISCINYLLKVMESFLLDSLQKEVGLKANQFGGIKGTGTLHFLVDTYPKGPGLFA